MQPACVSGLRSVDPKRLGKSGRTGGTLLMLSERESDIWVLQLGK
jgi:hypothetical protein